MRLSVRELVEFVLRDGDLDHRRADPERMAEGSRIHRRIQREQGEQYEAEVPLSVSLEYEGIPYTVEGRADGIRIADEGVLVDEIKTTALPLEEIDGNNRVHWGQALCYAYMLARQQSLSCVEVQLTYCQRQTGEIRRFLRSYTWEQLETFFLDLLFHYQMWAEMQREWTHTRDASILSLPFPFSGYRPGQRRLAACVYRTVRDEGRLLCQAPTGIGKTISTLYPTVKALGEGHTEKIFYLTAKTITRRAAMNACESMAGQGLRLRTILLTAKDKICFLQTPEGGRSGKCNPDGCPYAKGHFSRINDALYDLLHRSDLYTMETVQACAEDHRVCPFELQLDATLWCDCIVGDYNYLFDPQVYLRRFFDFPRGAYTFLIDEAHNLVDRAREMYSASLTKSAAWTVKKSVNKKENLAKALTALNKAFLALREGNTPEGVETRERAADSLLPPLERVAGEAALWLKNHPGAAQEEAVLSLYFDVLRYLKIADLYDSRYRTLLTFSKKDITVKQFCVDPSDLLSGCLDKGKAAVFFSATLSPMLYYQELLGAGKDAQTLLLPSPFPRENLCLLIDDRISTRYPDRTDSVEPIARMIGAAVQARQGNYMVFFPSYSYMREVYEAFTAWYPDFQTILQTPNMKEDEREAFLDRFKTEIPETILGFCVLGGIYSEGIDLKGDRLIGSIIVGVGLPQINPEQEVIRAYFEQQNHRGFLYAYQIPGMGKIQQAAGRVIRDEADRGLVLLIDDRFTSFTYRRLLPAHWNGYQVVRAPDSVSRQVRAFWGENTGAAGTAPVRIFGLGSAPLGQC